MIVREPRIDRCFAVGLLRPRLFGPGALRIAVTEAGVSRIDLLESASTSLAAVSGGTSRRGKAAEVLEQAVAELDEYFAGRRTAFSVPLDLVGRGTVFQLRVWRRLLEIPFGVTWSYARLAERAGSKGGARAAGRAAGENPLPVLIPCHRVVGSDGNLTGFSAGLRFKALLLELEGVALSPGRSGYEHRRTVLAGG
jgi:O-6-methylguanine DNA methyltransferase